MAGNVVVIANAKPDSTLDKKQILDSNGQELYEIRDEIMSVSHGMVGHKTGGNIFECHNHKTKMGSEYYAERRGDHSALDPLQACLLAIAAMTEAAFPFLSYNP